MTVDSNQPRSALYSMTTRTTNNSLRTRIGGMAAMDNQPAAFPSHPGQQQPAPLSPTPPPLGGDGDDGDGGGGDDDGSDDEPGPIDDPERPPYIPLDRWIEIQGLGLALANAMRANQSSNPSKGAKPRDPDRYDGSDPSKLDDFFFQCEVVFEYYPHAYARDSAKVLYAIQWLKDTAQRHFRNSFSLPEALKPDYYRNWDAFVNELRTNFGELDRSSAAVTQLLSLKMQEHHKVIRYKVDFEELAARTPWDDNALSDLFYKGLAERIKDQIAASPNGKATTLAGRKNQALAFDTRYWERKNEISQGNKTSKSSSSNNDSTPSSSSRTPTSNSSQSGSSFQRTQPSSNSNPNRNSNPSTSTNPSPFNSNRSNPSFSSNRGSSSPNSTPKPPANRPNPAPKLDGKVDEHGKLTEAEKQRRKALGLCLYCEQKGHLLANCPARQTKEEAKARRAAATTPDATAAPKN